MMELILVSAKSARKIVLNAAVILKNVQNAKMNLDLLLAVMVVIRWNVMNAKINFTNGEPTGKCESCPDHSESVNCAHLDLD